MNLVMVNAMANELQKISGFNNSNYAAPAKTGMGGNAMVSTVPRTGIPKSPATTAVKSTNYSIVNSTPSTASGGNASSTSKAIAPPPVRV